MDNEVKQRNRRRKRAQRMQAQRANKTVKDGDSGEDESPAREKPVRPPNRRKKSKEPLVEEDIIDGFAILGFRTYEDLENVIALSAGGGKPVAKARTEKNSANATITGAEDRPKLDTGQRNNAITTHTTTHSLLVSHSHGGDAGTSDDSGRASERLTGSSVAPRDPDSSRDRLSDASSRCSSGKGYICDSEGEDDKGSDAGSVLFASTPTPPQQTRKHEFPGSGLPPGVPGAGGASPVPAPMSPCLAPPAPSPAPAALPPPPPYAEPLKPPTAHTPNVQHGGTHVPPISQVVVGPNAGVGQDRGAAPPHDRTAAPPPHERTTAPPHDRTAPPSNNERTVLPSNHERTSSSNSLSSNLATTNHERTNHNVINHNVIISSNHSVTSLSNVNSQTMSTIGGAESGSNKTITGHQYMSATSNHSIMSLSGNAQMHPQSMSAASINNQAVPPTQQQQQQQQPAHMTSIGHMPPVHHSGIGLTNHSTMPPNQQQSMQQQQSGHGNVQSHHPTSIAPPPSINSIPNHVLPPNQPNHSLSNHPAQTLPVSRAPSPPPPLSAATPPASLPAALPQSAMAPATTSSPFISNGTPTNGYQQSTAPFPTYPPLYAPYAATMRNSVQPMPQHKSMMQQQQQQPPSTLTSVSSLAVSQVPTVAMTSAPPVITIPQVTTVAAITTSHRDTITTATLSGSRTHSPRGHSPTRERDSYSSNVSSLSRSSITPVSIPYSSTTSSSASLTSTMAFSKTGSTAPTGRSWSSSPAGTIQGPGGVTLPGARISPAPPPRPTPPPPTSVAAPPPTIHSFPTPMFAPPLAPPPVSAASPLGLQPNPNPFSADSLFQSKPRPVTSHLMPDQADLLRRELDNRFLASQDRAAMAAGVAPPPSTYLRTEMHQHQHHHTHVHQHAAPLLPPPPTAPSVVPPPSLFPPPLFKDIPKMGSVDSPFYRQNLGLSSYPGYSPGLLHPGLGGPTPFVPPNHLPSFQPKQPLGESSKPKIVKTGKWNAMHVRVAWEIYHHQQKQQAEMKPGGVGAKTDLLRPPSHVFPGGLVHTARPHDLPPFHRPPPFDTGPHPANIFASPSHLGGMSPFSRYGSAFPNPASPFGMSPFPPPGRELPPLGSLHDPWSRSVSALQRTVASYPTPVPSAWSLKPDPAAVERREQEERERERIRRERERERERERKQQEERERERERERREKERREMERRELERLHQQRLAENKARERSPMRNGNTEDIRVKEEPRQPKEDDVVMLTRTDPRYHPYLRHPPNSLVPPGPPRSMIPPPPTLGAPPTGMPPHYPPTTMAGCWPPPPTGDPFRDPYRYEPLRYNPLMEAAMRAEEERVKMFNAYANPHLRPPGGKDPATLLHMRSGPGPGPPGPQPPHMTAPPQAKDDSSQSR